MRPSATWPSCRATSAWARAPSAPSRRTWRRHAAAFTRGLLAGGVAATAKHFPGFGAVDVDPHHRLGVVEAAADVLETRELAPFRAALAAVRAMVMSGHVALPAITGDRALPATVSRQVMHGLLRRQLGFRGVSITDAMDMKALAQGSAGVVDSLVALRAGVDLLLLTPGPRRAAAPGGRVCARRPCAGSCQRPASERLARPDPAPAPLAGGLRAAGPGASSGVRHTARWRGGPRALAITLVRDEAGLLPLRPAPGERIVVITPQPRDLTPADSSADEPLALGDALRRHHDDVIDVRVDAEPDEWQIAGAREAVQGAAYVVVATLAADVQHSQARLVEAVLAAGVPTVTVAMRTPYDLAAYPGSGTHLCSYAIVPASVGAVADALFGRQPLGGRLPVAIPGLYPRRHGMEVTRWA